MAQKEFQLESFSCSVCLDLLKDPVMIPCGHSYCMKCITNFWDEEDREDVNSCPQCRQTFTPRPVLVKNIILADLIEQLKLTGLLTANASPPDQSYAGLEDVVCDICTGRGLKATKSCLMCLLSYCEKHLQPHYDVARLKKHQLVEPSKQLHENICSHHDELMKMFCRTDQQIICYVCTVDEHKGHDVVSAAAERIQKQKDLKVRRGEIQDRIKDREEDLVLLQQEMDDINIFADKAEDDNEKIFTDVIRLIQERSSELKQQIRSQQKSEVSRIKDLQEKLEQEICELKKKNAELEQLENTEDHNQFLQTYPSLSAVSESKHFPSNNVHPLRYFEDVKAAVSELREKLQKILEEEWTKISLRVTEVDVLLSEPEPEPRTRAGFLKYSQQITLDPKTAHKQLFLSKGNRKLTLMSTIHPDQPERFSVPFQVLSKQSLMGRCYWEVEWDGLGCFVAITYKDVYETDSEFGDNDKSWALFCKPNNHQFLHNKIKTPIPDSKISRVGVYLDQAAGTLSFYNVSGTMTLLHRVQTSFTEPLYAGIRLYLRFGDTAEIFKTEKKLY